jgi:hypothetical protein
MIDSLSERSGLRRDPIRIVGRGYEQSSAADEAGGFLF